MHRRKSRLGSRHTTKHRSQHGHYHHGLLIVPSCHRESRYSIARSHSDFMCAVSPCFFSIAHVLVVSSGMTDNVTLIYIGCSCSKPTCVICSRRCEGPSSLLSPISSPEARPTSLSQPGHLLRKIMPMRRLPLRANAATTNQKDSVEGDIRHSSIVPIWPKKHDIQPVGGGDCHPKSDGCSHSADAVFCKNCVREDITSGSIACFGCIDHSRK
ncbi:hypothetical protein BDY19DRAFT_958471 [Irpex rosettiformis]|uniref:Uncharacterized protein n=1 Tax=Irpex rosettiformis TaxID=378272 RepID=A0ACB8TY56_9APHY|nr:hypothetical protein BDY19DRAFT_958471 [Irpex rosettiformis]